MDENEELAQDAMEATVTAGADGRIRVPRKLLTLAGITTPRITAERVGDEIFLTMLFTGSDPPPRAVLIELHHPTLLHVPSALAQIFDAQKPITARVDRHHVRISGTVAGH
jgi:hypothetical protein